MEEEEKGRKVIKKNNKTKKKARLKIYIENNKYTIRLAEK